MKTELFNDMINKGKILDIELYNVYKNKYPEIAENKIRILYFIHFISQTYFSVTK